jgi:hypothetical protein
MADKINTKPWVLHKTHIKRGIAKHADSDEPIIQIQLEILSAPPGHPSELIATQPFVVNAEQLYELIHLLQFEQEHVGYDSAPDQMPPTQLQ